MGVWGLIGVGLVLGLFCKERKHTKKEKKRKKTPCYFNDGISEEEFSVIVQNAGKHIKRLTKLSVKGTKVKGTVKSQSGLSDWKFKVDFNDHGHITGNYWISSDNNDSNIPKYVADNISNAIHMFFNEENISTEDRLDEKCVERLDKSTGVNQMALMCNHCNTQLHVEFDAMPLYCPYCRQKLFFEVEQIKAFYEKEKMNQKQMEIRKMEYEYKKYKEKRKYAMVGKILIGFAFMWLICIGILLFMAAN